jgi:hypothetical protein
MCCFVLNPFYLKCVISVPNHCSGLTAGPKGSNPCPATTWHACVALLPSSRGTEALLALLPYLLLSLILSSAAPLLYPDAPPPCATPSSSTPPVVHYQRSVEDAVEASLIFDAWRGRASSFGTRRPPSPSRCRRHPWVEAE